jgi:transglutaminase-like putative cysteine protease
MLIKNTRQWDGVAGICLILIIFLSAYSLELTYWTYDLNRVTILALLGVFIGFILGLSTFSRQVTRLLGLLYGIAFLFLQLVISLNNSAFWVERVDNYFLRFGTSIDQLIHNIPLEDGILFLTISGILYCFLSINLGFKFIRLKKSWVSFITIVFFFYVIQFYLPNSQRNYLFISLYSLLVVVYLGRQFYMTKKSGWELQRIKAEKEISIYFSKMILIFTLILVFVSWGFPLIIQRISGSKSGLSPSVKYQEYSTSWEILQNFLYPLRQQSGFGEGYIPEILALGTSRSLKDDEAMYIKVPSDFSYSSRYYWKGRAYDYYENGLWQSKDAEIQYSTLINVNPYQARTTSIGIFSFIYKYPREIVFTPQIALKVERKADLIYFLINANSQDVLSIVDNQLVHEGEQLDIMGGFYNPDWDILLNSSSGYPQWITEKYLQLPTDFSEKITSLAQEISSKKATRIEKALAITNYLRNSFRYKDFVDIPQGSDPIEWFLFDSREGFCNYFSTADVLMLRSVGIPARVVVGYTQGERVLGKDEFLVRIKDSHSWVEAFFPESGWVILEPTPTQPSVNLVKPIIKTEVTEYERLEKFLLNDSTQIQNPDRTFFSRINEKYGISAKEEESKVTSNNKIPILIIGSGFLIVMIFSFIYGIFFRKKPILLPVILERNIIQKGRKVPTWLERWADFEKQPDIQKAYQNLILLSKILLFRMEKNFTPKEFFDELSRNLLADHQSVEEFSKRYQELTYGKIKDDASKAYYKNYIHLLNLILKCWKKKLLVKIVREK